MRSDEKLLKTGAAAKFLGIGHRAFQRCVKAGKLIPDFVSQKGYNYFSEKTLSRFKEKVSRFETKTGNENSKPRHETATTAQTATSVDSNLASDDNVNLPAVIDNKVTVCETEDGEVEVVYKIEEEDLEFEFDDIEVISFENFLPEMHKRNITKLFGKLVEAPFGEPFTTPFNSEKTLISYAKLDYAGSGVIFDRKFDVIDGLIMNSIYSFQRSDNFLFTSRNILQHIFGNVPDHFQFEMVELIEQHMDKLKYMRFSMDLKDQFGNNAPIDIHGEKYRPVALEESLLDLSILKMKSIKNSKIINVYRVNRLSPIFKYAEKLNQITSWQTELMKVPVRKTIQNALLCNYFLTKISLVRNPKNKYKNNGILFTTMQKDLNIDVSDRNKVKRIRDNAQKMFDYWVKIGLLESYCFEKKGKSFYKISFTVASVNLKEESQID